MPPKLRGPDSHPPSLATSPNPARVRENQRRSRARRKEYLEELEARLRSYESLGVQASMDIQLSARAVLGENARLREENAQLRIENEKLSQELDGRLEKSIDNVPADRDCQSLEKGGCSREESRTWKAACGLAGESNEGLETEPLRSDFDTTGRRDGVISIEAGLSLPLTTQPDALQPSPTSKTPSMSEMEQPSRNETASQDPFPIQQETNTREVTCGRRDYADLSTDTSSCEYAAQIITSMRADVTADDVRADLECNESIGEWKKCKVNNAKLFVAMDRYTV
ncbi:hypothetical protein JMJ35_005219 [Cladonia borealis]|uniref:BZIP domain-containing protein n=1 Tax=Cladonia borealis TaxID=184061 RepID=A0AA39R285_9LECA|nr:hypothetical protein JMJ35_005219 [Cladonia borealis]